MHFDIITLFPEMFKALECSIPGRAIERRLATLEFYNPREFTTNKHHTVDDKPYGGGPGMVMMAEPLYLAIQAIKQKSAKSTFCKRCYQIFAASSSRGTLSVCSQGRITSSLPKWPYAAVCL